jgi:nicotinamide phosphoribosyltransferase
MQKESIVFGTDSYKVTHWPQYPPGTEFVRSYLEARGGDWKNLFPRSVFFGLQYYLKEYLEGVTVTQRDIEEAIPFWRAHFGQDLFNRDNEYGGKLPVSIRAVPEGSVVDTRNVLMTIENTDARVPWLTNWLETILVEVWYPITVATLSREILKLLRRSFEQTGGDIEALLFKLHNFGFRGSSSIESAAIGDAAHLVTFLGTDTPKGIRLAMKYYGAGVCGNSIPASEHSTITAWGRAREYDAFENMLTQFPEGVVACVSDSFDIFKACSEGWGGRLREKVLGRNGTLVIRPDSGDPPTVVGDVLDILGDKFGYTTNEKGFKVLPPQVRVIQGDGVDYTSIQQILGVLKIKGWCTENVGFGMGGALIQKLNRDTLGFAFKCSEVTVNGEDRDVWKDPVTDPGKVSKRGRMKLIRTMGAHGPVYKTVHPSEEGEDQLVEVFRNGRVLREYTFDEVRERASASYTV